ncbi:RHS repeat-associated core domain-containing protein [Paenarthrobacter sp. NPDC089989]|uniref:RHS repeat-associated core domain-containing protein n=1 Tax=unclassified Paenarthrobacter TaxID=2634190 RepID=UPI003820BB54
MADGKPYCWGINRYSSLGAAVAPDTISWSPVEIDVSSTVLQGKALTGITISSNSTIITYTPAPVGWVNLELTPGLDHTLTSTGTYHGDTTGLYTYFYNMSATGGPTRIATCTTATTCTWSGPPGEQPSTYLAVVAEPYTGDAMAPMIRAMSYPVTSPPWSVSLAVSGSTVTATANYTTTSTGFSIEIYDLSQTGSPRVGTCSSGSTCGITPTAVGHRYIATVGGTGMSFPPSPLIATSNTVGTAGPTGAFETAGGSNPAELNDCYSCVGDPINTSNGEFFETEEDILVPGRGPDLALSRTYSSQRASIDGRFGYGWTDPYSMAVIEETGGDVQIHQENGSRVTFQHSGSGTYTASSHVLATLVKNVDNSWTYTRRNKEIFHFDPTGRLHGIEDLNGNLLVLSWDTAGQLTTVTDSSGRTITFTYHPNGKVATATDPAEQVASYTYDLAGRLEYVSLPGDRSTTYAYNPANLIISVIDSRGAEVTNTYDEARRVTKQTTAAGDLTLAYTVNSGDEITTITSPAGRITKEIYRAGQMIERIVGAGTTSEASWTYTYDASTFAKATVTDPLNRTSSATYDSRGNKLSATDIGGGTTTATYDSLDNVLTSTNPAGTTTTFTYDTSGNRLTASTPLTGTSQSADVAYTYGDTAHPGDLTGLTDANGHTTTFDYDTHGNRTTTTDALGRTTTTVFDVLGRKTSTTTPSGKTSNYTYTASGLLETDTDALGKTSYYSYDAGGKIWSTTDRMGRTTYYAHDELGRMTSTTAPDNSVTETAYDADGNVTSQTDQASNVTTYAYDSRNRLTSSTDALNRSTTYSYDAAGQLTGKTDPSNRTTTFTYNTAGDKTATSYSDGITPNESFTYTSLHQLATITDGTGTSTITYDSLGRLTSKTNGAGKTIAYAYDLVGNITSQTYPNNQPVTRAYDDANNLVSLTDWLNNTTTFATNLDGHPATTTYANGITSTTTYDDNRLITGIDVANTTGTIASFGYTRNDNGNLATSSTTGITQPAETYAYTDRDELASINTSDYGYDLSGNPTTLANGATLDYDAANQATQYTTGGTSTTITYDNQGNRLTGPAPTTGTSTYTWNQANQLTTTNGTAFGYDATGLRASRTPSTGPAQSYTWDTTQTVPLMLTDGAISYIYDASGNPVEHIDSNGTVSYYHRDQYGSTRLLTDSTGATIATFTFDANGKPTTKTGSGDTVLRWNGQIQDTDTGLYYLRARYYDPTTAQFLSADPLASITRDIYTYAKNNPLNLSDPLGLFPGTAALAGPMTVGCQENPNPEMPKIPTAPVYASLPVGTLCVLVWCESYGLIWGTDGMYWSHGTGFGLGLEASIGGSIHLGTPTGQDIRSVEAAGLWGAGWGGGITIDSPERSWGAQLSGGFGFGGHVAVMFTDYYKIF